MPEIAGSVVLPGAGAPETTSLGCDVAAVAPAEFVAVTTTRMVEPISDACSRYEALVAPSMSAHVLPLASHSRQRYANDVGASVQEPLDAVSVWPCCAVPEIAGKTVFAGGNGATTPVCCDVAATDPPLLVAVTTTATYRRRPRRE